MRQREADSGRGADGIGRLAVPVPSTLATARTLSDIKDSAGRELYDMNPTQFHFAQRKSDLAPFYFCRVLAESDPAVQVPVVTAMAGGCGCVLPLTVMDAQTRRGGEDVWTWPLAERARPRQAEETGRAGRRGEGRKGWLHSCSSQPQPKRNALLP